MCVQHAMQHPCCWSYSVWQDLIGLQNAERKEEIVCASSNKDYIDLQRTPKAVQTHEKAQPYSAHGVLLACTC